MATLRILRAGPGTTIQDGGRRGYLRFGVTASGPMDWIGHARANILAGKAAPSVSAVRERPSGCHGTGQTFPRPDACGSWAASG
jgi:5-oxoprolinase (ATP-hydrolysing) subunit C